MAKEKVKSIRTNSLKEMSEVVESAGVELVLPPALQAAETEVPLVEEEVVVGGASLVSVPAPASIRALPKSKVLDLSKKREERKRDEQWLYEGTDGQPGFIPFLLENIKELARCTEHQSDLDEAA